MRSESVTAAVTVNVCCTYLSKEIGANLRWANVHTKCFSRGAMRLTPRQGAKMQHNNGWGNMEDG